MPSSVVVWSAALLAVLLGFPRALWPIRADEAGYLLVARHWDPQPDSMYGTYWLDRPPILVALVKLADEVGGPLFPRVMAAVGCAVLAATLALGFKQNMAAGLVFGAVLLVGSLATERIDRAEFARLAAAALTGAAVPVVGTVGWALWAGVRLESVWEAVYGFRGDALLLIAEGVIADGRGRHRPSAPWCCWASCSPPGWPS